VGSRRRLLLERGLLLDAFLTRGKLGVFEYPVAPQPTPKSQQKALAAAAKKSATAAAAAATAATAASASAGATDRTGGAGVAGGGESFAASTVLDAEVPGEANFADRAVWGSFALDEVSVFVEPGHGVMGICCAVSGDGPGSTELLPKGGVLEPHGRPTGKLLTFKLQHPYEHVSSVTLLVGSSVIEAIQFHTSAPDGSHVRDSPLLGRTFSTDAQRVVLAGRSPRDMVVGFRGRASPHRLTALGLQVRSVSSPRTVFSCSWTPASDIANACLANHSFVRAEAKAARLAILQDELSGGGGGGGGGGAAAASSGSGKAQVGGVKEARRLAIEAGRKAEKDALWGTWEPYAPRPPSKPKVLTAEEAALAAAAAAVAAAAPPPSAAAAAAAAEAAEKCKWGPGGKLGALRTGDEEEVQVAEFMAVLRMRTVDVTSAQARTEALARRMWNGKACGPRSGNLQALRRLRVIGGLCGWYFRSLSFSLAEDAQVPPEVPETLAKRGRRFGAAAKHLRYQSETLHTKALVEAGKPRTWATSGMRTPQDRALEAALRARIAQTHAKAASLLRQAEAYEEEAEGYAGRAQALRPALPTCLSAHMYYHKRLGLARTQRKMEQEFGRDFFTATLNSVASGSSKATLSKMQLAKLVDAMELTPDPGLGVPGVGSVAPRLTGAFAPSGLW